MGGPCSWRRDTEALAPCLRAEPLKGLAAQSHSCCQLQHGIGGGNHGVDLASRQEARVCGWVSGLLTIGQRP